MTPEEQRSLFTIIAALVGAMAAVMAPVLTYFIGMRKARTEDTALLDARVERYVRRLEEQVDKQGAKIEALEGKVDALDASAHEKEVALRKVQEMYQRLQKECEELEDVINSLVLLIDDVANHPDESAALTKARQILRDFNSSTMRRRQGTE